jgi:hypothetical protein
MPNPSEHLAQHVEGTTMEDGTTHFVSTANLVVAVDFGASSFPGTAYDSEASGSSACSNAFDENCNLYLYEIRPGPEFFSVRHSILHA